MDVLTDSSLTLIVKTSEPENANVGERAGESPSLFLQSSSALLFFFLVVLKLLRRLIDFGKPSQPIGGNILRYTINPKNMRRL